LRVFGIGGVAGPLQLAHIGLGVGSGLQRLAVARVAFYEAGIVLEAVLERLISPKARQLPPGDAVAILHRADLDRRPLPAVVRLDVEQIVAGGTVAAADDVPA